MAKYVGFKRRKFHESHVVSDYYCGGCGYPVTDHDSFCPECGGAFHEGDADNYEDIVKEVIAYGILLETVLINKHVDPGDLLKFRQKECPLSKDIFEEIYMKINSIPNLENSNFNTALLVHGITNDVISSRKRS